MLILTSVVVFCLESMPYFANKNSKQFQALYITDIICVAWFTLEFIIRLIFCPRKVQFFKKPMNWIDFGAIIPFYLDLFISESNIKTIVVLRVVRLIRVFRIFKLSRHSYGLQILGHTLKSSCSELFLLAFFLSIGVVIFSSIIYYAEKDIPKTKFTTIPESFWWAVVTMTTLGYGDMAPESWEGKIVGSFCAISGVLMIALPVPVIVSNFSLYYSHAKARLKLPRRKRPLIIGAANALKVAQSFVTQSGPKLPDHVVEQVETQGQDDSEREEVVCSGSRMRWSPHSSFRSTPGSSPLGRRRVHSPNSAATPPFARNSLLSSARVSRNVLAVPEGVRIEMEMEERNPSCRIALDNGSLQATSNTAEFQQTSSSGNCAVNENLDQSTSMLPAANSTSMVKRELDCSPSDVKAASETSQRSNSSAHSISIDSSQGSPKLNQRGRMGRRGSLYVVGFTAKHWQNKALKKNKRTQAGQTGSGSRRASVATSTEKRRSSSAFDVSPSYSVKKDTGEGSDLSASFSPKKIAHTGSQISMQEGEGKSSKGNQTDVENALQDHTNGSVSLEHGAISASEFAKGLTAEQSRFKPSSSNSGKLREAYNKATPMSVSTESNDSSSRVSDDSLTINDRHRQRRGSSPLVRQRAVFTFDISDKTVQVDSCVGGKDVSTVNRKVSTGRPHEDNSFSLSPLLEQTNEVGGEIEIRIPKRTSEMRRKSCIPAIATERKTSVRKSKGQSFLPNGYVNSSYHHDEEDKHLSIKTPHSAPRNVNAAISDSVASRTLMEPHPVYMTPQEQAFPPAVLSSHGPPFYTEAKSFGQYSGSPQIQVTSNSDLNLPSISEEHVIQNTKARGVDANELQPPSSLPRPSSLPNWPRELVRPVAIHRPYSDSLYVSHTGAYGFPIEHIARSSLGNIQQPVGFQDHVSPVVNQNEYRGHLTGRNIFASFEQQRTLSEADLNVRLAQRRQGQFLYIHVPETPIIANGNLGMGDVRDRVRIPDTSRKERSRSKSYNCEHAGSPFFQRTESISSPDLHSMNGLLASGEPDPIFANGRYQSPSDLHQKRSPEDSKSHSFESTQRNASLSTNKAPTRDMSIPKCPQNVAVAQFIDPHCNNFARTRSSSWGGSSTVVKGHVVGRGENATSVRSERTDRQLASNGHEALQQRDSNRHTVSNRQRARAIFVGDSGIDSVNSSTTSITHSLEFDGEGHKERKESLVGLNTARIDILNPIHESETEISESVVMENSRNSASGPPPSTTTVDLNTTKQVQKNAEVKLHGNRMSRYLSNPDIYESSLV